VHLPALYAVLGETKYRVTARKLWHFLRRKLWDAKTKVLFHRWRDGERNNVQLLESYCVAFIRRD